MTAVDTLSIHYEKNVDRVYFFLHKSLHVERVGVGHQDFRLGEMSMNEVQQICQQLDSNWRQIVEKSQIVVVYIPKSLYSEWIEVRYRGTIDLTESPLAWYPVLPDVYSTFNLTMLLPCDYHVSTLGTLRLEEADDVWRLYQWEVNQQHSCCQLRVHESH
ncbi:hypothetical protein EH223_06355 [candidate division KSB1 bacterium]|nr:hypothetical protein [candidate division KSB1 bacterium]RQW04943.1 MAG: hypothetical protein EH223_06355 [candidate division KSB1 bacterium]